MSSNFLVFNPGCANQESDATYVADSVRSGGATSGGLLPSALFNKLDYQVSIFVAALAQALVTKGYSPNDGSTDPSTAFANLVAVLSNIITNVDLIPYALLNSPVFTGTPRSTTPAPGDNSTRVATTAFIDALVSNLGFLMGAGIAGQFIQSGIATGASGTTNVSFPIPFSSPPVVVGSSNVLSAGPGGTFGAGSITNSGFVADVATGLRFGWIAIGPR